MGVVEPSGPGHALALTSISGVIEVGALPATRQYYDPVGLPLRSARFHHWLLRAVCADEAAQTGLSCCEPGRACVPIPVPRGDPTVGVALVLGFGWASAVAARVATDAT